MFIERVAKYSPSLQRSETDLRVLRKHCAPLERGSSSKLVSINIRSLRDWLRLRPRCVSGVICGLVGSPLLFRQLFSKRAFPVSHIILVADRIDKRCRDTCLQLCILRFHVEVGSMSAEKIVATQ